MTIVKEAKSAVTDFSHYDSTKKLQKLAQNPFDLTAQGSLNPQRISKFCAESCGFKLLYGTERVSEEVIRALSDLAKESEAIKKMERLQSGEVMNFIQGSPSEHRPVLHTATRDFFDSPDQGKPALEAASLARNEVKKLENFIAKIDLENKFNELIVIGIGGSDLGPQAHYIALKYLQKHNRNVQFIGNIDPDCAAMILQNADLKKSLVLVVSKSGTTLETVTNEALVRDRFTKAGLQPAQHFISISCQGSPLDNANEYLACFHIWDWVGGRFCTTSLAGGLILSFAFGFDTYWQFLQGANAMDKAALNDNIQKNLPLLGALLGIWNRNFLKSTNVAIVPYSQPLIRFAAHLQQLDMESNGKRIDQQGHPVDFETGPIIFGEPGSSAQHSFFQLLHQGTTVVPIEFIGFKHNQYGKDLTLHGTTSQEKLLASLFAQAIALASGKSNTNPNQVFPGNRPSHILLAKQLTPLTLGSLLAYYEHKIAFQGFIWGINSFDQEGVQLGKQVANTLMEQIIQKKKTPNSPNSPNSPPSYPLGDSFLNILQSL
jgi:glucose-6-phosphate isomerase